MKKFRIMIYLLVSIIFTSLILLPPTFSHPGRTDANGGHYNRKTGEYHYHNKPTSNTTAPTYKESIQDTKNIEGIVYITKTGKRYHSAGCRYLSKSKISIDIKEAISREYTACSICGGVPHQGATLRNGNSKTNQPKSDNQEIIYHGNISSKKFHRPSCRYFNCSSCTAKFLTREDAIKAGYVPCKVCNP